MLGNLASAIGFAAIVLAHSDHYAQSPMQGPHQSLWLKGFGAIPGDGGTQVHQQQYKT